MLPVEAAIAVRTALRIASADERARLDPVYAQNHDVAAFGYPVTKSAAGPVTQNKSSCAFVLIQCMKQQFRFKYYG